MRGSRSALVGLGHGEKLRPEALGADSGGDRFEQRDEFPWRVAGEQPGKGGIELLGG
jgi:hypothetical protein